MLNIVLTGGPCGGKSKSLAKIESSLIERGYHVFTISETATEIISGGVIPGDVISLDSFQDYVLDMQLYKEKLFKEIAKQYDTNKVVILLDRGIGDQLAYTSKEKFNDMVSKRGLSISDIINRYDLVLHLVTAADGAEEFYQWAGSEKECENKARCEHPELARERDKATLDGWVSLGCEKLKVIDNSTDFEIKISRVLSEIYSLIGEPVPSEIERKFLIKMPSEYTLKNINVSSKTTIIQTYLKRNTSGAERRVRQRGNKQNGYLFYLTEKTNISAGKRLELEDKISDKDYIDYLSEADTSLHQIIKERYCFVYEKQFFELDIYENESFGNDYAILEIELSDLAQPIKLPPFLEVIKEVTDDDDFKNYSLAKTLCFNIKKDFDKKWIYETGEEVSEILGSGSTYYNIFKTFDVNDAFLKRKESSRNYLIRYLKDRSEQETYDSYNKKWY